MKANIKENTILMCPKIRAISHYAKNGIFLLAIISNIHKEFFQELHNGVEKRRSRKRIRNGQNFRKTIQQKHIQRHYC